MESTSARKKSEGLLEIVSSPTVIPVDISADSGAGYLESLTGNEGDDAGRVESSKKEKMCSTSLLVVKRGCVGGCERVVCCWSCCCSL
jgi:hypothetical protein